MLAGRCQWVCYNLSVLCLLSNFIHICPKFDEGRTCHGALPSVLPCLVPSRHEVLSCELKWGSSSPNQSFQTILYHNIMGPARSSHGTGWAKGTRGVHMRPLGVCVSPVVTPPPQIDGFLGQIDGSERGSSSDRGLGKQLGAVGCLGRCGTQTRVGTGHGHRWTWCSTAALRASPAPPGHGKSTFVSLVPSHQQLGEQPSFSAALCLTLIPAACGPG